jgi:hypothetical protein
MVSSLSFFFHTNNANKEKEEFSWKRCSKRKEEGKIVPVATPEYAPFAGSLKTAAIGLYK